MRRPLSLLLITVLTCLLGPVAFAGSAEACACGAVMMQDGHTGRVSREDVLLTRTGSTETITMGLSLDTDAPDAALVVPTPTPATATLGDADTFRSLSRIVAPVHRTRHHLVGGTSSWFDDRSGSGAGNTAPGGGVTALATVDLGPVQATTLRADDPDALRRWLANHGYGVRPAVQRLFDGYVAQRWSFVAMKLTPRGRTLAGALPPVTLSFTSANLIHPLRLSSAATTSQHVRTYVLSDHRTMRTDATAANAPVTTLYAGRPAAAGLDPALRRAMTSAQYLTASEQFFDRPATQITGDLTFARAADDRPYTRVIWHDEYVVSWDEVVLLAIAVAAAGGTLGWVVRRRARRQ